ncbi:11029_t:CDS:1, partial [Gigaspora margarita]
KLQYIDDPNQIPAEYCTLDICICKTNILLKFSESVAILECCHIFHLRCILNVECHPCQLADDNSMNNEQEVLIANTLMSLSYLSNTKVIASGQANQLNSESCQADQLDLESGLASQSNLESGQANQQNSKSGQATQPNSEYNKANKLKMSRK